MTGSGDEGPSLGSRAGIVPSKIDLNEKIVEIGHGSHQCQMYWSRVRSFSGILLIVVQT